jgi:transposase
LNYNLEAGDIRIIDSINSAKITAPSKFSEALEPISVGTKNAVNSRRRKTAMNKTQAKYLISDELWAKIEPLLPARPPHPLGCHNPRVDDRKAMSAIFFVLKTGCQWQALDATGICNHSSAHRRFQEWTKAGLFEAIWAIALDYYDELKKINWRWQSLDGALGKAPLGGEKNRAKSHRPS